VFAEFGEPVEAPDLLRKGGEDGEEEETGFHKGGYITFRSLLSTIERRRWENRNPKCCREHWTC
jgi:hypothetical protein